MIKGREPSKRGEEYDEAKTQTLFTIPNVASLTRLRWAEMVQSSCKETALFVHTTSHCFLTHLARRLNSSITARASVSLSPRVYTYTASHSRVEHACISPRKHSSHIGTLVNSIWKQHYTPKETRTCTLTDYPYRPIHHVPPIDCLPLDHLLTDCN